MGGTILKSLILSDDVASGPLHSSGRHSKSAKEKGATARKTVEAGHACSKIMCGSQNGQVRTSFMRKRKEALE